MTRCSTGVPNPRLTIDLRRIAPAIAGLLLAVPALGQYDPPPGYYATATGTGLTLKNALHDIIDAHRVISYDSADEALELIDANPLNASEVILVYSGWAVNNALFPAGGADREHLWPRSRGIGESGPDNSDLFNLRPCDSSVNSARGNEYYDVVGGGPAHPEAPECHSDATRWEPRDVEKGDLARSMFYMAVRYDASDANTTDLELMNGAPAGNTMGNLTALLDWHYRDIVSTEERKRNHTIYSQALNPVYYQNNRNPFIDRPEFVWAIWGPTPNDSRLYVGGVEPGNGASSANVDYLVIQGAAAPATQNVTLTKAGTNPTTYDISLTGSATSTAAGVAQAFVSGSGSRVIDVPPASVAGVGVLSGTITIDNTDLTSSGAGRGSADGNDTITVTTTVLAHSNGSFIGSGDQNTLTIDFGSIEQNATAPFDAINVHNLIDTPGLTADLDLDSISVAGDGGAFLTTLVPTPGITPGSSALFGVMFDTTLMPGTYTATYTLAVSDENLPGATTGSSLVLTLTGNIFEPAACPGDADGNGVVDFGDLNEVLEFYGTPGPQGDLNEDGEVNFADLNEVLEFFLVEC